MYWISTFVFDMVLYAFLTGLIMLVFYLYGGGATRTYLHTPETSAATFLLLWTYGLSAIPYSYFYAFAFENAPTAQISIMGINFITGFVMVMAYYIMLSIPKVWFMMPTPAQPATTLIRPPPFPPFPVLDSLSQTARYATKLVHLFRLFPPYHVGDGMINLSTLYYRNYFFGEAARPFAWACTGRPIVFMSCEFVVGLGVVLLVDSDLWDRAKYLLGRVFDRLTLMDSQGEGDAPKPHEVGRHGAGSVRGSVLTGLCGVCAGG
jgi:hypothetical protein